MNLLEKISLSMIDLAVSTGRKTKGVLLFIDNFSGSNTHALSRFAPKDSQVKIAILKKWEINESTDVISRLKRRFFISSFRVVVIENTFLRKSLNSILIQTWHGFPLKAMFLMDKNLPLRKKLSISSMWKEQMDYILSYSAFYNTVLNSCVGVNSEKFVITGMPRNDFLFRSNVDLRKIFEAEEADRFIIYLPTFRETASQPIHGKWFSNLINIPNFDEKKFNDFLRENKIYLIVKHHFAESRKLSGFMKKGNIIAIDDKFLIEKNIDLYEILAHVDILLTDYSSVYFDFLLLNKPIVFIPTDIDLYREKRGFLLEPYEMWTPGPKVYTQEELQDEILKSLSDPSYYEEERERLKNIVHRYQDAKSSERVWEFILDLLKKR